MTMLLGDSVVEAIAREHLRMGRMREFQEIIDDWSGRQPNNLPAQALRAWLFVVNGRHDEGRKIIQAIMAKNPSCAIAYITMGMLHDADQNHEAAELCYQRALTLDPSDVDAGALAAQSRMRQNDATGAEKIARKVLALKPKEATAYFVLAEILMTSNRMSEANQICEQGLALNPSDWHGWLLSGKVLELSNRASEARLHFERCLLLRPGELLPMLELAKHFTGQSLWEEAEQLIKKALVLYPQHSPFYHLLAANLIKRFRFHEAEKLLEQAIQVCSEDATLLLNLAQVHRYFGRLDSARLVAQQVKSMDPATTAIVDYFLADLGLLEGDFSSAFKNMAHLEHQRLVADKERFLPEDPVLLEGRRVILKGESLTQMMMFARYAQMLVQHGATVSIICPQPEEWGALFASLKYITSIGKPTSTVAPDALVESVACLPAYFGISSESTLWNGPYLDINPKHVEEVRALEKEYPRPWIGVELGKTPDPVAVKNVLDAIKQTGGTAVILGPMIAEEFSEIGISPEVPDLYILAVWLKAIDAMIATDWFVPAVAGPLGVPAEILLDAQSDPIWGATGDRSPWYPHLRLHRAVYQEAERPSWPSLYSAILTTLSEAGLDGRNEKY